MLTNRSALAALLMTVVGIGVTAGWLGITWLLFDPSANIRSEMVRNVSEPRAGDVAVGTPTPLIPDVSLTITTARWSSSISYNSATVVRPGPVTLFISYSPSNPALRFLVVEYEIVNGSDQRLSRDGLAATFQVTDGGVRAFDGMDFDTLLFKGKFSYGATTDERLLDIPPTLTYNGRWIFEVDSRSSPLRLTNELIDFDLLLPVDIRNPLID